MNISGLLTSAGINIGVCTVLTSLYSVLRKQPSNLKVYFGQRLAQVQSKGHGPSFFERLVPSPSWIIKAWQTSEEDLFAVGGLDAAVFSRVVIFSMRILSVAAVICIFLVLPVNYFGQSMHHKKIQLESLEVFTIGNVIERSRWMWVHCLALYVITFCACALLYIENKSITKMRLAYITGSPQNLGRFTVLVRAIPWSGKSYSDSVTQFFTKYYPSSYLSHQIVYLPGTVRKLVHDAEKMYNILKAPRISKHCGPSIARCGLCGVTGKSFRFLPDRSAASEEKQDFDDFSKMECPAALVFFRTRYAAHVAAQTLQSTNPMLWVTEMAPEPADVFWANLCVPYRLLWVRRLGSLIASIAFLIFFLVPVSVVQGLVHLDKLKHFSFVRKLSEQRNWIFDLVTGYLPSAMLTLFIFCVPPIMMVFSAIEGPVARSCRKKSASIKVLYFLIWNVFFANILSGSVLQRFDRISSLKDIPLQLAKGIPSMAVFFMTYILTSGWTSLALELMQPISLLLHWLDKCLFRGKHVLSCESQTFPYQTELPRVLLFGLLGFTSSITAPLLLPFLLVYFFFAHLVYRNQFMNVYVTKYDTGGLYWPIAHTAVIVSLMLMQVILLGVFGLKKSAVASSFTIPLIICTFLFHLYCRQRFLPVFKRNVARVIMDMDEQDEHSEKFEEYHEQLQSAAYCQFKSDNCENGTLEVINERLRSSYCSFKSTTLESPLALQQEQSYNSGHDRLQDPEDTKPVDRCSPSPNRFVPHSPVYQYCPSPYRHVPHSPVNQYSPSPNRYEPRSPGPEIKESKADMQ
ncbi:CSC1-like protein RXW8 isoform X2 [Daucus carota subsp. sativus]|uniref:CSC1-like protein RXW8 isoform X2 n=1 Tax=Daucus carota subsp. sativus TaxID=79200 RepID=UPI003082AF7F